MTTETLSYDIDIAYVFPEEVFSAPGTRELLDRTGVKLNARANYVASFRDPRTAEALAGAADVIKDFFKASGFGFLPSGKRLAPGTFEAKFDDHLTDVYRRMNDNLPKFDLPKADDKQAWNGFSLVDLLVAMAGAKPADSAAKAEAYSRNGPAARASRATISSKPSTLNAGVVLLAGIILAAGIVWGGVELHVFLMDRINSWLFS